MTAQQTQRPEPPINRGSSGSPIGTGQALWSPSTKAADKAYERRMRRLSVARSQRLRTTGSPIAAALTRVPFVGLILLLLAGGIVGVLYLNTISDAAGLRASQSRLTQLDLNTKIEADNRDIASLKDPSKLAEGAKALGLVPPGDAAILKIGADGQVTVIGTPAPVPSLVVNRGKPNVPAAPSAVTTTAAAVAMKALTPTAAPPIAPPAAAPVVPPAPAVPVAPAAAVTRVAPVTTATNSRGAGAPAITLATAAPKTSPVVVALPPTRAHQ